MAKRRPRPKAKEPEADLTSMIDVVFLLLIFFMVVAKFKTLEGKLEARLPRDLGESAAPAPEVTPRRIELKVEGPYAMQEGKKVTQSITVFLGDVNLGTYLRPVFATDTAQRKGLIEERNMIYQALQQELINLELLQDVSVRSPTFIAPDLRIPADDVIQALDAVVGAGITDLTFAGKVSDIEKLRKEDGIEN